jgi:copper(I)-binding protein/uncharacterized protein YcnI
MTNRLVHLGALACACLFHPAASAHVVLPPGGAAAGSTYAAAFEVGHACKGASATTALAVTLPAGFTFVSAQPRPGWTLSTRRGEVTWTAATPQAALPGDRRESFVVTGRLPTRPGTLWFRVRQACDVGMADWHEPVSARNPKPEFPAPRLEVLAPGVAAVDVREAWARPTVPGQTSSGVYARLTAPAGARLVGASTPLADAALHEMRMEGDVMRMRDLPEGLDLPPGQPVALEPGSRHLMLTALKRPLTAGSTLPLTLHFVDRDGRKGRLELQVPVRAEAPAASAGGPAHD